jgi:hypothetical protein
MDMTQLTKPAGPATPAAGSARYGTAGARPDCQVLVVGAGPTGPYRDDLDIVTADPGKTSRVHNDSTGLAVLVRPDGHVAVRARPGSMYPVISYLLGVFSEPVAAPGAVCS